jgi:hypothetical protein
MDSELRLAIEELRAQCWLRLGRPAQALAEIDRDPPDRLAPTRQFSRTALRAAAADAAGDAALGRRLWLDVRAFPEAVSSPLARLCVRAMSTVVLDDTEALVELSAWQARAVALQFPAGLAVVQMSRVARCLATDQAGAALDVALEDVQALLAARSRIRHRFVDEAEVLALACSAWTAAGLPGRAQALQVQARQWLLESVRPHVPADCLDSWHARPAVQSLLGPPLSEEVAGADRRR